jgi:hypothetical protein
MIAARCSPSSDLISSLSILAVCSVLPISVFLLATLFVLTATPLVPSCSNADRRPLQELQKRKGFEMMNEVKSGELSEDELRERAALGQVLGLLSNNPNKGRREDSILGGGPTHNVLITLVRMLSKREREFFLELLKADEF